MTASRHRRLARTGGHPPRRAPVSKCAPCYGVPSAARERALRANARFCRGETLTERRPRCSASPSTIGPARPVVDMSARIESTKVLGCLINGYRRAALADENCWSAATREYWHGTGPQFLDNLPSQCLGGVGIGAGALPGPGALIRCGRGGVWRVPCGRRARVAACGAHGPPGHKAAPDQARSPGCRRAAVACRRPRPVPQPRRARRVRHRVRRDDGRPHRKQRPRRLARRRRGQRPARTALVRDRHPQRQGGGPQRAHTSLQLQQGRGHRQQD